MVAEVFYIEDGIFITALPGKKTKKWRYSPMNDENRTANFSKTVLSNIKSKDMNSLKMLLASANEVDVLNMIQDHSFRSNRCRLAR